LIPEINKETLGEYRPKVEFDKGAFKLEHLYYRMFEGTKENYHVIRKWTLS
jgi:hypothetical protein